jgi:hypothetical protein
MRALFIALEGLEELLEKLNEYRAARGLPRYDAWTRGRVELERALVRAEVGGSYA